MGLFKTYRAALRPDLRLHLTGGFVVALVATLAVGYGAPLLPWWPGGADPVFGALVGAAIGVAVGWGKEYLYDASGRGTVDRRDFLVTGRGAIVGATVGLGVLLALS